MPLAAAATLAILSLPTQPAVAQPAPPSNRPSVALGDVSTSNDVDNRGPDAAPTAQAVAATAGRDTAVRWNRYGTPATLIPRTDNAPRAAAAADPVAIARAFLATNRAAFGLLDQSINSMDVLVDQPMGEGSYVMLRQRFGTLPSNLDGLAAFGIRDGAVVYMSSTISPNEAAPEPAAITEEQALAAAADDAGLAVDALSTSRVTLGAVPMPGAAPRSAYQVVVIGNGQADLTGYTTWIDARTGKVLFREDIVDHDVDNPEWSVFPANPPADYSSTDTRLRWCLTAAPGCERTVRTADTGAAWDVDPATGLASQTSFGNSTRSTEKWDSLAGGTVGTRTAAASPTRDYTYPWTNQWFQAKCDPAVFATPQENDINAALANLFTQHNRMHDWSYQLGFTEATWNMQMDNHGRSGLGNDLERGNAQAGGRAGGAPPDFPSRDNANQATPPDGLPATTNMFLWQPLPGAFYAPCVDGDYDMSVIGHEYSHAISGRMIGGPDTGWQGTQGGAMNESDSDQFAMEYLFENGFRPSGNTPFVTGGYVTGDPVNGIRNYDMSKSPLNYSNLSYDLVGQEVHSDSEIWSAVNFDVRAAFLAKYGQGTPALQRSCAEGTTPVNQCPGNRRWVQVAFDGLLLSASGAVSMVDMRNAMLAADMVRFGGADNQLLWQAFAQNGLGRDAVSNGPSDQDATPSFVSAVGPNATLRLVPAGQSSAAVRLYVGDYEARTVPVADTDPATPLGDTLQIAPGNYTFVVAGAGFGAVRVQRSIQAGEQATLVPAVARNLASASQGATVTGDGVNLGRLIDDSEATNWASLAAPVAGRSVVVDLAGTAPQTVGRVQVSAYLRPAITGDPDPGGQNRFTALRQFEVLSCNNAVTDCSNPANFRSVFTSPANAFPADLPRPTAGDLNLRSFRIPPTTATHLMLRVLTNQCTGGPAYAGKQHNDPRSTADCTTGNPTVAGTVRIAEFQAYNS